MSEADKKLLKKYSKETLIEYLAALGLLNYRILDAQEKAFHAKSLVAEHDRLCNTINSVLRMQRPTQKQMIAAVRADMRLKKVERELDVILAEAKADTPAEGGKGSSE